MQLYLLFYNIASCPIWQHSPLSISEAGLGTEPLVQCIDGSRGARNAAQHMGIILEPKEKKKTYGQRNICKKHTVWLQRKRFTMPASHTFADLKNFRHDKRQIDSVGCLNQINAEILLRIIRFEKRKSVSVVVMQMPGIAKNRCVTKDSSNRPILKLL